MKSGSRPLIEFLRSYCGLFRLRAGGPGFQNPRPIRTLQRLMAALRDEEVVIADLISTIRRGGQRTVRTRMRKGVTADSENRSDAVRKRFGHSRPVRLGAVALTDTWLGVGRSRTGDRPSAGERVDFHPSFALENGVKIREVPVNDRNTAGRGTSGTALRKNRRSWWSPTSNAESSTRDSRHTGSPAIPVLQPWRCSRGFGQSFDGSSTAGGRGRSLGCGPVVRRATIGTRVGVPGRAYGGGHCRRFRNHPGLYPRVSGDIRRALIRRFPFGIFLPCGGIGHRRSRRDAR